MRRLLMTEETAHEAAGRGGGRGCGVGEGAGSESGQGGGGGGAGYAEEGEIRQEQGKQYKEEGIDQKKKEEQEVAAKDVGQRRR